VIASLRFLFAIVVVCALAAFVALAAACAWWYPQLPTLEKVTHYRPQQALQVYTADRLEIAQFGAERRLFLTVGAMPPLLKAALISVEDSRFLSHSGIDPVGVARALVANATGGRPQGASTITQQVARTFFLSSRRTLERKIKEAMLAIKIEATLSKDQILELYLNQIYLGNKAYGFGAAAQVYFGKTVSELSVAETAMLVGLPQNPAFANPIANPERAVKRQRIVLKRMETMNVISSTQRTAARAEILHVRRSQSNDIHAEYVAEMVRQTVVERFGEAAYREGYKVYTTLVANEQEAAYRAVRKGVIAFDRRQPYRGPEGLESVAPDDKGAITEEEAGNALAEYTDDDELRLALVLEASPNQLTARLATGEAIKVNSDSLRWANSAFHPQALDTLALRRGSVIRVTRVTRVIGAKQTEWAITQWPEVQSALVSMDSGSGRIRALVGGFDFAAHQFNHVTHGWRQPGSTFKPFIYSAALEKGMMPATVFNDEPLTEDNLNKVGADWNPQNSDGLFEGPITLRRALAGSRNMVSIQLSRIVGVAQVREWAELFGFDAAKQPHNLTIALGAGSATPLQLASAYSVFANKGYSVAPVLIERITDTHGTVLFEAPKVEISSATRRVVSARNAFIINSLLQEVTATGTAARAQSTLKRNDIYGKTGTTNDAVDAWFAGFHPSLVAVVWMGYDQPKSLGKHESGGGLALPIWLDYMATALKNVPVYQATPPEGVEQSAGDWVYSTTPDSSAAP
jgi:penicillin-binding protein 1A